jgi:hypothetical protein
LRVFYFLPRSSPKNFTLTISGECQFSIDDKRQLSAASRIGYLGCWLVFEKKAKVKRSIFEKLITMFDSHRLFIFRKSLSPKHYARLCRIILKMSIESKSKLDRK